MTHSFRTVSTIGTAGLSHSEVVTLCTSYRHSKGRDKQIRSQDSSRTYHTEYYIAHINTNRKILTPSVSNHISKRQPSFFHEKETREYKLYDD